MVKLSTSRARVECFFGVPQIYFEWYTGSKTVIPVSDLNSFNPNFSRYDLEVGHN